MDNEDTIYDVATKFTCAESIIASTLDVFFAYVFGSFNNSLYGEYLATAFDDKISYFKQTEPSE